MHPSSVVRVRRLIGNIVNAAYHIGTPVGVNFLPFTHTASPRARQPAARNGPSFVC